MQKEKRIIPPHQVSHRLDRMAIPYLIWLYIFALIPVALMIFLMFVDAEGVKFDGMEATVTNFQILTEKSTIIAFWNSVKYSIVTTVICVFFGYLVAYSLYK